MSKENNPQLPDGHYAISAADKVKIQSFGRELAGFIQKYVSENAENGRFPYRIILGGFNYYTMIQEDVMKAAAGDSMTLLELASEFGADIEEPFGPEPAPTDVEIASPAPSESPEQMPIQPTAEVETITESKAAAAAASAVSVEEAEAQGIDTQAAAAEAVPVEVVPDAPTDGTFDPTRPTEV